MNNYNKVRRINYAIFQLREDREDNVTIRFLSYNSLEKMGVKPTNDRYKEVYRGTLTDFKDARSVIILGKLYEKFNLHIPGDFRGHSLSVGDVVELNLARGKTFYFVDSIGFRKLENFESAEAKIVPKKMKERENNARFNDLKEDK